LRKNVALIAEISIIFHVPTVVTTG